MTDTTTITTEARRIADLHDASVAAGEVVICRGSRTGTKLHLSYSGASGFHCGFWTQADTSRFQTSQTVIEILESGRTDLLCKKCFAGLLEALNN